MHWYHWVAAWSFSGWATLIVAGVICQGRITVEDLWYGFWLGGLFGAIVPVVAAGSVFHQKCWKNISWGTVVWERKPKVPKKAKAEKPDKYQFVREAAQKSGRSFWS